MEGSLLLSQQELESIHSAGDSKSLSSTAERRKSQRRPCQTILLLGPYGSWGLPTHRMFCEVRCHDLSQGGVSFFLPRPPTFEFAVIGLGKRPNISYFLIRLTHFREHIDVEKQYLVGGNFIQRVKIES